MHNATTLMPGLLALALVAGCNSDADQGLPTTAPTKVELLTDTGFRHAGAVESSPDGETFYAAAFDEEDRPGVFAVDVDSKTVSALHVGEPLLYPSDLAMSCDGSRLFVADMGLGVPDSEIGDPVEPLGQAGGVFVMNTEDGSLSPLEATGIARASGAVVSTDCETLYVTGMTEDFQPAVFSVPVAGGAATVIHQGEPLVSPTGVHVDDDNVCWVMDHGARNDSGEGLLFAITLEGDVSEVVGGLGMGRHGGVSLVPGGTTAVIPVRTDHGVSQLVTANTKTGDVQTIETPDIAYPTGTAAARNAPVMVVAGEQSISIATFE
jgi:DNA-binding beta-propeller fold protein YncE